MSKITLYVKQNLVNFECVVCNYWNTHPLPMEEEEISCHRCGTSFDIHSGVPV